MSQQENNKKHKEVSLCMIVKNEEEVLKRCLESAQSVVDEIIIVDTGSTDSTKEIARLFTDKILDFKWINDFSAARNFAFAQATKEYILWLDADDFITEKDQIILQKLKGELTENINSVVMKYHLCFDDEDNPIYSIERNRLVKRSCNFKWIGSVHEYLEVYGNIIKSEAAIRHKKVSVERDKSRNLQIYREKAKSGATFSSRDLFYYGNELSDHEFNEEALEIYEQFLERPDRWLEDIIATCIKMAELYSRLDKPEQQISSLLRTFNFDIPRAEVCCELGGIFLDSNNLDRAIFWYELATRLTCPNTIKGLSHNPAAWTWLPHLQLCLCYDKLSNYEIAEQHNNKALEYNPTHPSIIYNKNYFDKRRNTDET